MMRIFALLFALVATSARAGDEWKPSDTAWQVAFTTMLALDCAQTRYGASHPHEFEEGNPVLGDHPSKGRINSTCAVLGVGHYLVAKWLPQDWRRVWQMGTSWTEVLVVFHNDGQGSGLEFSMGMRF